MDHSICFNQRDVGRNDFVKHSVLLGGSPHRLCPQRPGSFAGVMGAEQPGMPVSIRIALDGHLDARSTPRVVLDHFIRGGQAGKTRFLLN